MNTPKMTANCLSTLDNHFGRACYALCNASTESLVVMIRAMEQNPLATVEDLTAAWALELGEPADADTIGLVHCLRRLIGAEWYVVTRHFFLLDYGDGVRDVADTRKSCPFYGDEVEEVRELWREEFADFDSERAKESMKCRLDVLRNEMDALNLELAA